MCSGDLQAQEQKEPYLTAITRSHALAESGRRAEAAEVLDSLHRVAAATGDERLRLRVLGARGTQVLHAGRPVEAGPMLEEAAWGNLALGDTSLFCRNYVWLGAAFHEQARYAEAESLYREALPLARAVHDRTAEAFLLIGLAYTRLLTGEAERAIPSYEQARTILHEAGSLFGELQALTGLGRCYHELGRVDRSVATFREVARLARESGQAYIEANALNNIGTEELVRGDPAAALASFRGSVAVWRGLGALSESAEPWLNVARALVGLGRMDEASAVADSVLRSCQASSLPAGEIMALSFLLELHEARGDSRALALTARALSAAGEKVPAGVQLRSWQALATAQAMEDSTHRALETLERYGAAAREGASVDLQVAFDIARCRLLEANGRQAEIARIAQAAERQAASIDRPDLRLQILTLAARADLALGRDSLARTRLADAEREWERYRALPADPGWREWRAGAQELYEVTIAAHLADATLPESVRARTAYDAVRRFKARALLDRLSRRRHVEMAGSAEPAEPGSAAPGEGAETGPVPDVRAASIDLPTRSGELDAGVTLRDLQRTVLRPDELLLDVYAGRKNAYLFAVTPRECRVVPLPGVEALAGEISLFHDAITAMARTEPGAGPKAASSRGALLDGAARALSGRILEPVRDLLEASSTLIYAPDGIFNHLPLEFLLPESDVARIPATAVLARTRRDAQTAGRTAGPVRGLILRGAENAEGDRLSGAAAEARLLARSFARMKVTESIPVGPGSGALSRYDVIHVAAHAELNDQYPWRSAIFLAPPTVPRELRADSSAVTDTLESTEGVLRAEAIAGESLDARLVVLSACQSAAGTVVPGEGVLGLTGAFLASGVPTVVATLWPIDDEQTQRFMLVFYRHLARGLSAGAALREARREAAQTPAGSDPFHWSGFVLVGDPATTVPLEVRGPARWGGLIPFVALLVSVLAVVAAVAVRRAGRGRRRDFPVTGDGGGATHS